MRSPEKALFDYFYSLSLTHGLPTFDYLPAESETSCPFIYIGQTQTQGQNNKYSRSDHIFLTIDVWGSKKQRKTVSEIADGLFNCAIGRIKTAEYEFYGRSNQQSKQMMIDTSVPNTVYQRGHIEIEMEVVL